MNELGKGRSWLLCFRRPDLGFGRFHEGLHDSSL